MLNGPGPIFLEDYSIRHVPNIGILEENRRLNGPGPISLEFSKKMACRMGRKPISTRILVQTARMLESSTKTVSGRLP